MQDKYPDHEIVSDIGSGINYSRKNFLKLIDRVIRGDIEEIVVSHKDRLCRFGFELIEHICRTNETKLVVLFEEDITQEEDIARDIISIVTVYSAKINGKRRYSKIKEGEAVRKRRLSS
jgi:predicted site-specific integrase-resolvase